MIHVNIKGVDLVFETSPGLFSPQCADRGTLAMLSVAEFMPEDKVLDLGCGYGTVGILAARLIGADRVTMTDIDETAVDYAGKNAVLNMAEGVRILRSDGFRDIDDNDYTVILSNPPYHEDFSVPKMFVEKGFNRLCTGGRMYMVTKREKWYRNKLTSIFGGVKVWCIDDYFVFMSVKKSMKYAIKSKKKD